MERKNTRTDKKKIVKEKGITLIALIITIIVMLILVSVSINIVINSGLFKSAGKAAKDTKLAKEKEQQLAGGKVTIGGKEYNSIEEYKKLAQGGSVSKIISKEQANNAKLNSSSVKEVVQTRMLNTTYEAPIPVGFTVSGKTSERSIDEGLVIYLIEDKTEAEIAAIDWEDEETVLDLQKTYDQFVWIPIPRENINNMYICQGKTTENGKCDIKVINGQAECQNASHKILAEDGTTYKNTLMAGRLYTNSTGEIFEKEYTEIYTASTGLREPDIVSESDNKSTYLGQLNSILETEFKITTDEGHEETSNRDFKTYLQEEYNEVVKSVYENQGFYVGRYETSGMENTDTNPTIKVVAGTTTGICNVTWYRMYAQQKKYAENKNLTTIKSSMIQGAAYDQVMKFVENGKRLDGQSYTIKTPGNVGHEKGQGVSEIYQTCGLNYPSTATVSYNDCVKNIYDLEGNVRALTTEAMNSNRRISRGGNFGYSRAASARAGNGTIWGLGDGGSLLQLYIVSNT